MQHLLALAHIGENTEGLTAGGDDLVSGAPRAVLLDLGDDDFGALAREDERDPPPDTLPGAGDDGDLSIEAAHALVDIS